MSDLTLFVSRFPRFHWNWASPSEVRMEWAGFVILVGNTTGLRIAATPEHKIFLRAPVTEMEATFRHWLTTL